MVPLRTRLQNGDIVEILTAAAAYAEPRLAQLRRHLARAQRRSSTSSTPRKRRAVSSSAAGSSRRRLRRFGVDKAAVAESRAGPGRRRLRHAQGRRPVRRHRLWQGHRARRCSRGSSGQISSRNGRPTARSRASSGGSSAAGDQKIKVRGIDDLMVFRARCCNPIRGEKIVGYITRGKGVSVHCSDVPQRRQSAVRPGTAHRRRMGPIGRCVAVFGAPAHQRRGPARHPGRREFAHRRHRHEHPRRRGDRRRPTTAGRSG